MSGHELGFRSVDEEYDGVDLPVEGAFPSWLDGTLYRNGPGLFEAGGRAVNHWFDGLAYLRRFGFDGGDVAYTARFLRSSEYESATDGDGLSAGQFATERTDGLVGRIRDAVFPSATDNANVNVLRLGDRLVAVTETPEWVELDPATLETRGGWTFDDDLGEHHVCAHPHRDPHREETVNLVTEFGRTNHYHVYRIPFGTHERERVASVPAERPAYLHSFGLTPGHVVIAEFPLVVNPLRFFLPGGGSFIDHYDWQPDRGTRLRVIDRDSGAVVAEPTADPVFCFHHVNAFEDGDDLVLDLVAFEDHSVISSMALDDLRSSGFPAIDGELRRYRIDPRSGSVEETTIYDGGMALPRAREGVDTQPYRYAYAQATANSPDDTTGVVKVDTETGEAWTHREDHLFLTEPVVVPDPEGESEDDGVVLSVGLDTGRERSVLVGLDAATLEPVARAYLPHAVPFDFHGQFFRDL